MLDEPCSCPGEGERPEGMFVSVGGNMGRTTASLRFKGEDLDPDVLSQSLQCVPSIVFRKGDPVSKGGRGLRRRGMWALQSRLEESCTLEEHVGDLLCRVTGDLAIWGNLARFKPDVFCGLSLTGFNQGAALAPTTMKMLAARGISLELDIYSDALEE